MDLTNFWRRVMHFLAWVLVGCFSVIGLVCLFSGRPGGYYYTGVCLTLVIAVCPILPMVWWGRIGFALAGMVLG